VATLLGFVSLNQLKVIKKRHAVVEASLKDQISQGNLESSQLKNQITVLEASLKNQNVQCNAELTGLQQTVKGLFRQRDDLFVSAYQREEVTLRPDDAYDSLDRGNFSPSDTEDRTRIDCKGAIYHKHSAVILTLGQSNAANTTGNRFDPSPNVLNFSLYDGKCYLAQEPLIGPTNYRGNFVTRLASKLVDRGAYQVVIVAPIAVGGTKVQDWAVGGFLNRRVVVAIKRLHDAGLQPTHVLWHQGEANVADDPQQYASAFLSVFSTIRRNGVYAPIYVAEATICGGKDYAGLRSVQHSLVDPAKGILAGPNTDEIGLDKRYDKCHLSAEGAEKHAEMWYEILDSQ
jgi:hypothetical protein